jgi:hypothetical protein
MLGRVSVRFASTAVRVATVLERYPRLIPQPSELQREFAAMSSTVGMERATLTQSELEQV